MALWSFRSVSQQRVGDSLHDSFSPSEAIVACQQLGYSGYVQYACVRDKGVSNEIGSLLTALIYDDVASLTTCMILHSYY